MSAFERCLHLAASQPNINITIHEVLDNSLSSVNSRLLKRSKFNSRKEKSLYLRRPRTFKEYRTVKHGAILTNDLKHSTVDDMKIYETVATSWGVFFMC